MSRPVHECPAGILDEFLQSYGSLIPVSADEVVEKLEDIFQQEFSTPQRWGRFRGGHFRCGDGHFRHRG